MTTTTGPAHCRDCDRFKRDKGKTPTPRYRGGAVIIPHACLACMIGQENAKEVEIEIGG